ncbi:LysR substrate-binding domain-containing protein [Rhizobium sp. 0TCS1.26]|uniref:LysR family transcriptional regulator n=1 Tax=Rhizobium sp. 0TCS1.26 TaxID=3142623 RepID=UPI003D2DF706
MTLEQLRIFLEVAERQHVTRAAEVLNLTQSSVSAAIAAFEARHAVRLFNRVGRGIELTEAGRLFLPEARKLLDQAAVAARLLADLSGTASGSLRIHASQTVASYWLPQRLMRYHAEYAQVDLGLTVGNTHSAAEAVLAGRAELAVVEGDVDLDALTVTRVGEDQLVLVVGGRHAWADGRSLSAADCLETSWIQREPGSGTRAAFETEIRRLGLQPDELQVVLELPSNEAVIAAVEAGESAAVLSSRAVEAHVAQGRLRAAALPMPNRPFFLLRHSERHVTRAMRAMIDVLGEG